MADIRSGLKHDTHAKRAWHYRTQADNIGHILYPGYFDEVSDELGEGDYIFVTAVDGFEALYVKSANPPVVVRANDMHGPSNMFPTVS